MSNLSESTRATLARLDEIDEFTSAAKRTLSCHEMKMRGVWHLIDTAKALRELSAALEAERAECARLRGLVVWLPTFEAAVMLSCEGEGLLTKAARESYAKVFNEARAALAQGEGGG